MTPTEEESQQPTAMSAGDDSPRRSSLLQSPVDQEDLARVSGVAIREVVRFVESGVLSPDPDGLFRPSDVAKARLVAALVDSRLSFDHLAAAVQDGRLSLDFVEHLMPQPTPCVSGSPPDVSAAMTYEELIQPILGTDRDPGDPIRDDDLALLRMIAAAVEICGSIDDLMRIVRAVALSARHLVEVQSGFVDEMLLEPALKESGSPMTALATTAEERLAMRVWAKDLVSVLIDRFLDDAVFGSLVHYSELALASGGVASLRDGQSIVFVDVTGYTRLSEEAGDEVAAQQALLLAEHAHELAGLRNGRLVKSLGDGAMVHLPDPTSAVGFAIDAVTNAEERGLWALHAGANTGPMLRREGDYYGTTVNVAARVADQAGSGQVIVTRPVVDSWAGGDSVRFVPVGSVALKNVADPVELFEATG
jgi:adenylate cyclase